MRLSEVCGRCMLKLQGLYTFFGSERLIGLRSGRAADGSGSGPGAAIIEGAGACASTSVRKRVSTSSAPSAMEMKRVGPRSRRLVGKSWSVGLMRISVPCALQRFSDSFRTVGTPWPAPLINIKLPCLAPIFRTILYLNYWDLYYSFNFKTNTVRVCTRYL